MTMIFKDHWFPQNFRILVTISAKFEAKYWSKFVTNCMSFSLFFGMLTCYRTPTGEADRSIMDVALSLLRLNEFGDIQIRFSSVIRWGHLAPWEVVTKCPWVLMSGPIARHPGGNSGFSVTFLIVMYEYCNLSTRVLKQMAISWSTIW